MVMVGETIPELGYCIMRVSKEMEFLRLRVRAKDTKIHHVSAKHIEELSIRMSKISKLAFKKDVRQNGSWDKYLKLLKSGNRVK